jgi:hypothetical protein
MLPRTGVDAVQNRRTAGAAVPMGLMGGLPIALHALVLAVDIHTNRTAAFSSLKQIAN